jgi:hypothetical protein
MPLTSSGAICVPSSAAQGDRLGHGKRSWRRWHLTIHPAKAEADGGQLVPDLLESRFPEIADLEQLVLRIADQVADGADPLRLQTIGGSNRQLQLRQASVELLLQLQVQLRGW